MMRLKLLIWMYNCAFFGFKNYFLKSIVKLEGGYMYSEFVRRVYESQFRIEIGYGTYGGCFNKKNINAPVKFGNYCSIAPNVKIYRANHPDDTFTTHPIVFNPIAGYVCSDKLIRPKLTIGNDVWIGEDVIILPSVDRISDGVIIGAGSIVTKNIDVSYSVYAGNPVQFIRRRFSDDIIHKLEASKWWKLKKIQLIDEMSKLNKLING
ncbi:CatB-related O-acetyltransferase [Flavicella sp.]|uniref:CatB-related O-acetyltransferase n=1 Tax=Flavicella sp. TaxID=2957742 RepID=UPI003016BF21